ncbi:hypothetical protein [Streptosporangium sp. KLBMP 9127]|nr:hypothetical protein [Streptosporangium sp. KLBMP 9127]
MSDSVWRLAAAFLVPVPPAAAALSDLGFFGRWSAGAWAVGLRLNYALAGLKPTESAVKAGDYALAEQRLLECYRACPTIETAVPFQRTDALIYAAGVGA